MGNKCGNGFALSWLQPAMGVTLVGLAAIAGCQGSPSSSPASSTGNFRFGQQTQQAIDQVKNQAQGTAQAGNTALQSGAQDLQKSVSSQMASLDAQRQQLTLQAQSSTGQAKQNIDNQVAAIDAQRAQLTSQLKQAGQTTQQNLMQTRDSLNQSALQIQQTLTTPLPAPAPVPAATLPAIAPPTR